MVDAHLEGGKTTYLSFTERRKTNVKAGKETGGREKRGRKV